MPPKKVIKKRSDADDGYDTDEQPLLANEDEATKHQARKQRPQRPQKEPHAPKKEEKKIYTDSDAYSLGYTIGRNKALQCVPVNPSWEEMAKDKYHFVRFLKAGAVSENSEEYEQLYNFLLKCFTQADTDFDGIISEDEFFGLIEIAFAAPRKFGFAPSKAEMEKKYGKKAVISQKVQLFKDLQKPGIEGISFDAWLKYALDHIKEFIGNVELAPSGYDLEGKAFHDFFKAALEKGTSASKELYMLLLRFFTEVDLDHDGTIGFHEFDQLLLCATKVFKEYGFPIDLHGLERVEYHKDIFVKMDKNDNKVINFDEWLEYARSHIASKVAARAG